VIGTTEAFPHRAEVDFSRREAFLQKIITERYGPSQPFFPGSSDFSINHRLSSSYAKSMPLDDEESPASNSSRPSVLLNMSPHRAKNSALTNHANTLLPEEETALRRFRRYAKENGHCQSLEDGLQLLTIQLSCELNQMYRAISLGTLHSYRQRRANKLFRRLLRAHNLDLDKSIDRFRIVQDWRENHAISKYCLHIHVECDEDYREIVPFASLVH
jgi:hypothetical protein